MKYPWFWRTLLFWILAIGAVNTRALIFLDEETPRRIQSFEVWVNGDIQKHEIWSSPGSPESFEPLVQEWKETGWNPASEGLDLGSALLNLPQTETLLTSMLRISAYQKMGRHRFLAVAQTRKGSVAWIVEMPQVDPRRKTVSFRRKSTFPPENISPVPLEVEAGTLRTLSFRTQTGPQTFRRWAQEQGYSFRPGWVEDSCSSFELSKGSQLFFGRIESGQNHETVSLMQWKK